MTKMTNLPPQIDYLTSGEKEIIEAVRKNANHLEKTAHFSAQNALYGELERVYQDVNAALMAVNPDDGEVYQRLLDIRDSIYRLLP